MCSGILHTPPSSPNTHLMGQVIKESHRLSIKYIYLPNIEGFTFSFYKKYFKVEKYISLKRIYTYKQKCNIVQLNSSWTRWLHPCCFFYFRLFAFLILQILLYTPCPWVSTLIPSLYLWREPWLLLNLEFKYVFLCSVHPIFRSFDRKWQGHLKCKWL